MKKQKNKQKRTQSSGFAVTVIIIIAAIIFSVIQPRDGWLSIVVLTLLFAAWFNAVILFFIGEILNG